MQYSLNSNKTKLSKKAQDPYRRQRFRALTATWLLGGLWLFCCVAACSESGQADEKLLAEAYHYHEQALQQSSELRARLRSLEEQLPYLKTPEPISSFNEKINSCRRELLELEMNVPEVPGFEHGAEDDAHGHHHHHHHHHHESAPSLSPEQHLKVQQAYLQATKDILYSTDSLDKALQKLIRAEE